ncbi:MAG: hypothetical protein WD757_06570 [Actinomycetota bacterium]
MPSTVSFLVLVSSAFVFVVSRTARFAGLLLLVAFLLVVVLKLATTVLRDLRS